MSTPDALDDLPFRRLTDAQAADLLGLAHDLDQLDRHGPEALGLAERIAARRARLSASGIPEEEQPR